MASRLAAALQSRAPSQHRSVAGTSPALPRCPCAPRAWQLCLFVIGFWTFVAGIQVGSDAVTYARLGRTIPWLLLVAANAIEWGSWALITPALYSFVRSWPLAAGPRLRTLAIYGAAAVTCVVLNVAAVTAGRIGLAHIWPADSFFKTWSPGGPLSVAYVAELERLVAYDALLFIWVTLALHAFIFYGSTREREIEAARLHGQLAEARLDALTMQLQPHFLFNALNTISGLVPLEPRRADRMITRLADVLRVSLRRDGGSHVPLKEELQLLDTYLEIQQTRFDERLIVEREIDSRVHDALVPAFLLQPIVENTIRHAVAPYSAPVRVTIAAHRLNGRLRLTVRDDGPGLPVEDSSLLQEGVGLRNTRVRLEQLYGVRHRFTIQSGRDSGVDVVIELPLQTAPAPVEPERERTP